MCTSPPFRSENIPRTFREHSENTGSLGKVDASAHKQQQQPLAKRKQSNIVITAEAKAEEVAAADDESDGEEDEKRPEEVPTDTDAGKSLKTKGKRPRVVPMKLPDASSSPLIEKEPLTTLIWAKLILTTLIWAKLILTTLIWAFVSAY